MSHQFDAVLIANRGEIAVRVTRTLRRLGIRSVAIYSEADRDARHVAEADTAILIGTAAARDSYLNIDKVIAAAVRSGADAIHPGYGFLSENTAFAQACERSGITFIGPGAHAIEVMGDKITAKNTVAGFGVPVVPGIARPGLSDADLISAARDIGYPLMIKPSAGGGGKGMYVVSEPAALGDALSSARRQASAAFGDDTLFLERFVLRPRHIEVQVLGDQYGAIVHLGERECSLQRRHQKVIEEAPSPLLDATTRARIGAAACDTARSVDYQGAGTVEFIVSADAPDEFFFMEMNTRLQVEHPVTEMVTGLDLVEWQIRVASGEALPMAQSDVTLTGHAIEARIYAEDPSRGFLPTGGVVVGLREPQGAGVRVDSGLARGTRVGSDYDPMLAKIIAHGVDRSAALTVLDRALADTAVLGVVTNIEFIRFLLRDADVQAGRLDTGLLDRRIGDFAAAPPGDDIMIAAGVVRWLGAWQASSDADLWGVPTGWRVGQPAPAIFLLQAGATRQQVRITGAPAQATVAVGPGDLRTLTGSREGDELHVIIDGQRRSYVVADFDDHIWLADNNGTWAIREAAEHSTRPRSAQVGEAELTSPMPGTVIAVNTESGTTVIAGTPIVIVEAMKMEHPIVATTAGVLELLVIKGQQVKLDQVLARVIPDQEQEMELP